MQPSVVHQAIIVRRDADYTCAVYHNMAVTVWHRTMTLAGVEAGETAARMAAQYGAPILCSILESLHAPPSEEVRRALPLSLNYLTPFNPLGCSLILEGTGMLLAGARSIASGLLMAARPPYPMRVHATVDEACDWLCTLPAQTRQTALDFRTLVAQGRKPGTAAASA